MLSWIGIHFFGIDLTFSGFAYVFWGIEYCNKIVMVLYVKGTLIVRLLWIKLCLLGVYFMFEEHDTTATCPFF